MEGCRETEGRCEQGPQLPGRQLISPVHQSCQMRPPFQPPLGHKEPPPAPAADLQGPCMPPQEPRSNLVAPSSAPFCTQVPHIHSQAPRGAPHFLCPGQSRGLQAAETAYGNERQLMPLPLGTSTPQITRSVQCSHQADRDLDSARCCWAKAGTRSSGWAVRALSRVAGRDEWGAAQGLQSHLYQRCAQKS